MNKTEKIKDIIQRYDLTRKDRSRRLVYQRTYLIYKMYRMGFTLKEMEDIINLHYTTILYHKKRHEMWCNAKDEIYLNIIAPLMEELEEERAMDDTLKIEIGRKRMLKTITITGVIDSKILDNLKEYMTFNELCENLFRYVEKS